LDFKYELKVCSRKSSEYSTLVEMAEVIGDFW